MKYLFILTIKSGTSQMKKNEAAEFGLAHWQKLTELSHISQYWDITVELTRRCRNPGAVSSGRGQTPR